MVSSFRAQAGRASTVRYCCLPWHRKAARGGGYWWESISLEERNVTSTHTSLPKASAGRGSPTLCPEGSALKMKGRALPGREPLPGRGGPLIPGCGGWGGFLWARELEMDRLSDTVSPPQPPRAAKVRMWVSRAGAVSCKLKAYYNLIKAQIANGPLEES